MILIRKGREPASLTLYRKTAFAYFDGCNKDDIRQSLLEEQGYLCAYCMRRISSSAMKIEHWKPEALLTETEKLDFSNMLGVCKGHIDGLSGDTDTCDAHKGCSVIEVDPRSAQHIRQIRYDKGTGLILSDNKSIQHDLNDVLNLNCRAQNLPQNRRAVLRRVISEMRKRKATGDWSRATIEKYLQIYENTDRDGKRKEYAGIVIWYLKRKLT